MAKRKIFTGKADCLYKKCRPVTVFDDKLHSMLDDMAETMYDAEGAGLAASQIGILRRVAVIDCNDGNGLVELINPEIIETFGEQGTIEGCLSFPGENGYVKRPNTVVFRAQDRFGNMQEHRAEGFYARAVMHETDHLDGKVYLRLVTDPPEGYLESLEEEDDE